ncbi:MAG: hypothetical protein LC791_01195 [Acidobacteria bacterium]|nr:hypothetical protein [Acidobacteriota bacterium]
MNPPKFQPALLGGLVIGVLSALPVINLANCCCAWILFGGGLAAYLMQQNYPGRIGVGDGALVGLLAGLIGAFVWAVVSIPLNLAIGPLETRMFENVLSNPDLPPEFRALFENFQGGMVIGAAWLVFFFLMLFICALFGMVGGLFGALMFAKDAPPPPPPPHSPIFTPPTFTPPPLPGSGETRP